MLLAVLSLFIEPVSNGILLSLEELSVFGIVNFFLICSFSSIESFIFLGILLFKIIVLFSFFVFN